MNLTLYFNLVVRNVTMTFLRKCSKTIRTEKSTSANTRKSSNPYSSRWFRKWTRRSSVVSRVSKFPPAEGPMQGSHLRWQQHSMPQRWTRFSRRQRIRGLTSSNKKSTSLLRRLKNSVKRAKSKSLKRSWKRWTNLRFKRLSLKPWVILSSLSKRELTKMLWKYVTYAVVYKLHRTLTKEWWCMLKVNCILDMPRLERSSKNSGKREMIIEE